MTASHRIPVTLGTGFLGAGKTTLINHILASEHGRETTALADPAPVIQTFFLEPDVSTRYELDGVVTRVSGRDECIVFQGVHALMGAEAARTWSSGEARSSPLVFIGRRLPRAIIESGLAMCVAGSRDDPARVLRAAA